MKIIDNKRVDLTNDEFSMYEQICRSYDRPNFKGEYLFESHFETNGEGIITFVKPPTKQYSTLEVFCFLISVMVNQHLRLVHNQMDSFVKEAGEKYKGMLTEVQENSKKLSEIVKNAEAVESKQGAD